MKTGCLIKLQHREDADHKAHTYDAVPNGHRVAGSFFGYPEVGSTFLIGSEKVWDIVRTSTVKSIYTHGSGGTDGWDKLVLPKDFPNRDKIVLPALHKGDILFATHNSIYLLTDIMESV